MRQTLSSNPLVSLTRLITGISLGTLLLVGGALPARAQGGGAEAVSAGAAVAGVVVEVIGGLSTWIGNQSNDCAAAGLGAAWGKDCDLQQKECTDTGYFCASCYGNASNSCAYATGGGFACEGAFGMWSGCDIKPYAFGFVKGLHGSCDSHSYKAWGKCSIDGTSEATTVGSPGTGGLAMPVSLQPAGALPAPAPTPRWPAGTVLVVAKLDTVTLNTMTGKTTFGKFNAKLRVNGHQVWSVSASLDKYGQVATTGALKPTDFRVTFDRTTGRYTAKLIGYRHEVPVDTLAMPTAAGYLSPSSTGGETTTVDVSMESETNADGSNSNDGVCALDAVTTCNEVYAVNDAGSMTYLDHHVSIGNNVTVMSPSTSSLYLDTYVTDGTASLHIVDPFHAPGAWQEGQQVHLAGYVTMQDGDPVLTNVTLTKPAQIIQPAPLPQSGALQLDQNEPNPFNPVTTIAFSLATPQPVRLAIYSVTGRLVRTLADGAASAGHHEYQWDGRGDDGASMPSGFYFYTLEAGGQRVTRKMLMMK